MIDKIVSSLITSGNAANIYRINEDWLVDDEFTQIEFIKSYYKDNEELPTFDILNDRFGTTYPVKSGRFIYEFKQLKERHIYGELSENIPKLIKSVKDNPADTLEKLRSFIMTVGNEKEAKDLHFSVNARSRFDKYQERVGTKGVTYLSTGDEVLDKTFYGWNRNDLVTIGGRAGLGKTWLMCRWALTTVDALPDDKGPVLFVTNEISDIDIAERLDCMVFKLPYENFLKGELNRLQKIRYQKGLRDLEDRQKRLVVLYNINTIRELEMKIRIYNPSIVFIDGSYLLEPKMQEGYEKIMFITRSLKGINKDYNIPVINSTQLKRSSGTKKSRISFEAQDDFAWGSSYTQDSDIAFRAFQTPDMVYYKTIGLDFAKGRRVKPGISLTWYNNLNDMSYSFTADGEEEDTSSSSSLIMSPTKYKEMMENEEVVTY